MDDTKRDVLEKRKYKTVVVVIVVQEGVCLELTHHLGSTFEVMGYVRPGNGLEVITGMAKNEIDGLTKEDMRRYK
jgi:hypothetical protein